MSKRSQTLNEEIANSITHGIGLALSIAALSVLVSFAGLFGDVWRVVSFSIFGAMLVLLYLASTLYHSFQSPRVKHLFHIFDRAAIFLLIAGTYTPFTLVNLRGPLGWTAFGIIWGLAICGVVFTLFFVDRYNFVSVIVYVGMGWLVIFAVKPLFAAVELGGILWLGAGGLFYTAGVIFYAWKSLPFHHSIWHLFVLGGSLCHFFSIFFYVLPMK